MVLDCQYLKISTREGEKTWNVRTGSGMGLICSGEISDLSCYYLAELPFVLLPAVRRQYGISLYVRFKDDILIAMGGDVESRAEFLRAFRRHSRYFQLKVDSVSSHEAVMLDTKLFKGPRWNASGKLDWDLYV